MLHGQVMQYEAMSQTKLYNNKKQKGKKSQTLQKYKKSGQVKTKKNEI